jgi:DNA polymerase-3 subunit gamma/tau
MAYEVTATRRRPKTFDEMSGQEFVVATLKNAIEKGRIAHAYLFSGPRGCGKTSAARILARSLNCDQGPTGTPCGVCSSCLEITRGSSLDIIEIDGASNTGVNDVRQIKDEVLFPPQSGQYKIYIIDEVHMLSNSAFNALLKTIEEPPPYIVFIFATTELHKVPATIKSRCQQFAFRLISIETIAAILKETCGEMRITAEEEALFWIAKESTGSLRDAYTLFDQVVSFSGGHIRSALIREKLGLIGLDNLNAFAEACAENDAAKAFLLIDDILNAGVAVEQFIIDLTGYYHSLLFLKAGVTRESLLDYSPERFSSKALDSFTPHQLEHALDVLLNLYRDIRYSVAPRFELEAAASKLCWLNQWISPLELRKTIAGLQSALCSGARASKGGLDGHFAEPERSAQGNGEIPKEHIPADRRNPGEFGSLSKNFDHYIKATRESGISSQSGLITPARRHENRSDLSPKEPKPPPPSFENAGYASNRQDASAIAPQAERVLRLFSGTIVKNR